ncbi:MAG: hypothetical protein MRY64_01860 [Hyphomonadaceae bacterium]|nr:hypothetical protein [Hyphomonadaceae bacterium]
MAISLSACGGMSNEAQAVADACVEIGQAQKSVCTCFAREASKELSKDELASLSQLIGDPTGMKSVDIMLESASDEGASLLRLGNISERAMGACS